MKINWDNIEDLTYLEDRGIWRSSKYKYFKYVDSCNLCNEPFLQRIDQGNNGLNYCSRECQIKCPDQRKKQGKSLSKSWVDPEKRKNLLPNMEKAVGASQKKRHQEVALLDKSIKVCSICGEDRPVKDFTRDARLLTGIASACRYCKRKQYKSWVGYVGNQQQRNEYMRSKEKTDPKFKLRRRMSTAIYTSIVGDKNGRRWECLVGYELGELKKHLEKQFTDGMSWNNYGEWHIDHKIPIRAHNFTKPEHEDFKRCWSLDNLQPLWAKDNMSKGARLRKLFQPRLAM